MSEDILAWLCSGVHGVDDIDKKIEILQGDIAFLQHKREVQVRSGDIVAHLPQEILLMIFEYLPLRGRNTEGPNLAGLHQSFFPCTHVCRRWRDFLVSAPSFWTSLYVSMKKDIAQLFIDRGGHTLPLRLLNAIEKQFIRIDTTIDSLVQHQSSRIRELVIEKFLPKKYIDIVNQSNFPILESLTIASSSESTLRFPPAPNGTSALTPTLRYLELRNISVHNISSPCFSKLSTMKLIDIPNKPALVDLLRAFQRMYRLENLVLNQALRGTIKPISGKIYIPSLKSLEVQDDSIRRVEGFLKYISSPQMRSIIICSSSLEMTPDILASAASAFYALIPPPASHHRCYQLTMAPGPGRSWYQSVHVNPHAIVRLKSGNNEPRTTPPYKFSVTGEDHGGKVSSTFADTLPSTVPPIAVTLQFNRPAEASFNYDSFTKPQNNITKLIIDSLSACEALLLGCTSTEQASSAYYPQLEEVVWVADRGVSHYDTRHVDGILRKREEKGLTVKKLTFMCEASAVVEIESWRSLCSFCGNRHKATEVDVVILESVSSLGIC
ncbi:hypothetical protein ONZ45_g6498 [Pleurotus djamor]|nr:hypothetical protein ONZ45_g6498 [Pleurotus djamor]